MRRLAVQEREENSLSLSLSLSLFLSPSLGLSLSKVMSTLHCERELCETREIRMTFGPPATAAAATLPGRKKGSEGGRHLLGFSLSRAASSPFLATKASLQHRSS